MDFNHKHSLLPPFIMAGSFSLPSVMLLCLGAARRAWVPRVCPESLVFSFLMSFWFLSYAPFCHSFFPSSRFSLFLAASCIHDEIATRTRVSPPPLL